MRKTEERASGAAGQDTSGSSYSWITRDSMEGLDELGWCGTYSATVHMPPRISWWPFEGSGRYSARTCVFKIGIMLKCWSQVPGESDSDDGKT